MTCRDSESLILAERDGALTKDQFAVLSDHVTACPACRKLRADLAAALDSYSAGVAGVPIPDANEAWRDLQARLHKPEKHTPKRPLASVVWFSAPLVAAAALALAFILNRPAAPTAEAPRLAGAPVPTPLYDPSTIAGADFVEAGDPNASTLVYVDKESGWLVVWATNTDDSTKG